MVAVQISHLSAWILCITSIIGLIRWVIKNVQYSINKYMPITYFFFLYSATPICKSSQKILYEYALKYAV